MSKIATFTLSGVQRSAEVLKENILTIKVKLISYNENAVYSYKTVTLHRKKHNVQIQVQ